MKFGKTLFLAAFAVLCLVPSVRAEEAKDTASPPATAKPADHEKRLELARKMHELRPVSRMVESAVRRAAQRLPERDREAFVSRMVESMDEKKIEDVSLAAMAEIFTVAELERMLAYYGAPEARSIAEKMPVYQGRIRPEISRMLDAAIMSARTGAASRRGAEEKTEKASAP